VSGEKGRDSIAPAFSPLHAIKDKFIATLFGCAVGDAVGFAFQWRYPRRGVSKAVLEEFEYESPYGYPPGQFTDDTQMTLAIAEAIVGDGDVAGEGIAREFVRLWKEGVVDRGMSCDDAVQALMRGVDWMHSGTKPGRAGNGTAMRASPIGLWDYDDIGKLVRDSEIQSIITHADKRCAVGAILVAAAVAYNIKNDAPGGAEFPGLLLPLCNREGGADYARYLDIMGELLEMPEADAVRTIARAGQERTFDRSYITPFVVPTVLISIYAFLKNPDDFLEALAVVYRARGDIDTTGAITGAISGSRVGAAGIPEHLSRPIAGHDRVVGLAGQLFKLNAGDSH